MVRKSVKMSHSIGSLNRLKSEPRPSFVENVCALLSNLNSVLLTFGKSLKVNIKSNYDLWSEIHVYAKYYHCF